MDKTNLYFFRFKAQKRPFEAMAPEIAEYFKTQPALKTWLHHGEIGGSGIGGSMRCAHEKC